MHSSSKPPGYLAEFGFVPRSDRMCFLLIMMVLLFVPLTAIGQTGSILGEITDAMTGETLVGVNVIIMGTQYGVATDVDGRYRLRRVPVGEQVLEFRYIGFEIRSIQVMINEGELFELNVKLNADFIEGDEIFVVASQRGQARALTRQRESLNIRTVIDSEQIDRFADETVSGSLRRIAGMGHGADNIRGVGSGTGSVVVDGQRLGTTGQGTRSTDMETISVDIVQDLEVIKVITPDMDADALSGVISINTRRPIGGDRSFNARLGGGMNTRILGEMGPNARASISYGDSPTDFYSYGVNLSYQRTAYINESFSTEWFPTTFLDTGPVNVLDDFTTRLQMSPRNRFSSGLQFTFQPTERSTYHVRGMFNYQYQQTMNHGMNYGISTRRYTSPTQTGPMPSNKNPINYLTNYTEEITHQYTFQAGGRHIFEWFDLDYSLGWGHGRVNSEDYNFNFNVSGAFDWVMNLEDRWQPRIDIAPWSEITRYPSPELFRFQQMPYTWNSHVDNEFKSRIDLEAPFDWGKIKFGSSALLSFKSGDRDRFSSNFERSVSLTNFELNLNTDWRIFDRAHDNYHIPWLIDLEKARDFYHSQRPRFPVIMSSWAEASETSGYKSEEHVIAGYGMTMLERGRFKFLGGARVEHSMTMYTGKVVTIDGVGEFVGAVDVSETNAYTYLFPNAQFIYAIGRFTNVRLAYSRSIGRANFTQLAPNLKFDNSNLNINKGNPELNPMVSNNLDFLFEHYFMNVGQFTVGLFYKELSDFVFSYVDRIGEEGFNGDPYYEGWRITSFDNGEEATVYGIEVSWQQYLDFLPGFLGNFGTYANFSYSESQADLGRRDTEGNIIYAPLLDHRPYVVNAGLDYSQGGFSGQLSFHWGSPSISSYGNLQLVPEVPGVRIDQRVYFDRYRDAANELALSVRYRLTDHIRIYTDITNILNHRSVDYFYNRDVYPFRVLLSGRTINMGVRYSL